MTAGTSQRQASHEGGKLTWWEKLLLNLDPPVESTVTAIVGLEGRWDGTVLGNLLRSVGLGQTVILEHLADNVLDDLLLLLVVMVVIAVIAMVTMAVVVVLIERSDKGWRVEQSRDRSEGRVLGELEESGVVVVAVVVVLGWGQCVVVRRLPERVSLLRGLQAP